MLSQTVYRVIRNSVVLHKDLDSVQFPLELSHMMLLLLELVDDFLLNPGHLLLLAHTARGSCHWLSLRWLDEASWAQPYLFAEPLGLHRHSGVSAVNLQDADGTDTRLAGATIHLHGRTQHSHQRDTTHSHQKHTTPQENNQSWSTTDVSLVYYSSAKRQHWLHCGFGVQLKYYWNTTCLLLVYHWCITSVLLEHDWCAGVVLLIYY